MQEKGYDDAHPIDVSEIDGELVIIDGHHRRQAAIGSGIKSVPVVIHEVDSQTVEKLRKDVWEAKCDG
jgi:ParB-like chromosome segregation protein Spo0J